VDAVAAAAGVGVVPYSGLGLDRVAARRADPDWLATIFAAHDARVIPMWRDNCIVHGSPARAVVLDGPRG
jgi:NAD+ diphosphatase